MKFIINEFDGWPLFDPIFFKNETRHIYKIMLSLFKSGISPLFNLYVTTSLSNPEIPIIEVVLILDSNFSLLTIFPRYLKLLGFLISIIMRMRIL